MCWLTMASTMAMSHYAITKINKTFTSLLLTCVLIGCIKKHINYVLASGQNSKYEECQHAVYPSPPVIQAKYLNT